jgi:hypothetical protein
MWQEGITGRDAHDHVAVDTELDFILKETIWPFSKAHLLGVQGRIWNMWLAAMTPSVSISLPQGPITSQAPEPFTLPHSPDRRGDADGAGAGSGQLHRSYLRTGPRWTPRKLGFRSDHPHFFI